MSVDDTDGDPATALAADFKDFDMRSLAEISSDERAIQVFIREQLIDYIDLFAQSDSAGQAAAARMRSLVAALVDHARQAQTLAGDDLDRITVGFTIEVH